MKWFERRKLKNRFGVKWGFGCLRFCGFKGLSLQILAA